MRQFSYLLLCLVFLLLGCNIQSFSPSSNDTSESSSAPAPTPIPPIDLIDQSPDGSFCFTDAVPTDIPEHFVSALFRKRSNRSNVTIPSAGNTYYVCDTGDDSNDGLSQATPFRTFDKAMSTFNSKMQAGDQILFCRGGVFTPSSTMPRWVNPRCRADNPCIVSDYYIDGTQNLTRPILQAGLAGNIFRLEDSGTADHEEGYVFKNLILKGKDQMKSAFFLYNDITDVTIENVVIDGFGIGVQVAGSNAAADGSVPSNDRITLRDSDIINNSDQGWLGGGSDDLLEGNCFRNNGYNKSIFLHNIYYSGHGGGSHNSVIRDNILLQNATVNGTKCEAVSLVVHGIVENLTIDNNLVYEAPGTAAATCWGIAVDGGYSSAERFPGLVIKNNLVMNVGNVAIGCTSCSDGQVDSNTIIYSMGTNMGVTGIAIPNRTPGLDDAVTTGMEVTNNTIISNNAKQTVAVKAKNLGTDAFEVMNNLGIYETNLNANCMSIVNDDTSAISAINNQCSL